MIEFVHQAVHTYQEFEHIIVLQYEVFVLSQILPAEV